MVAMFVDKHKTKLFKQILLRAAKFPILYILLGIACLIFSHLNHYFSHINIPILFDIAQKAGNIFIFLGLIVFIYNVLVLGCQSYEMKLAENQITAPVVSSIRLRNIGTLVLILLTIVAILMNFSSVRNIGISLIASAGFLTAILGLAAQKGLSSIFAGLQIALSQRIKIGDRIVIENSAGIIEEITLTYVIIKLDEKRRLVVPINFFIDQSFESWSHDANLAKTSCDPHLKPAETNSSAGSSPVKKHETEIN